MSTVLIVIIVVVVLVVIALLVSTANRRKQTHQIAEAQVEAKHDDVDHHREQARDARAEAELSEERAKRAAAEADLNERQAERARAGAEIGRSRCAPEPPRRMRPCSASALHPFSSSPVAALAFASPRPRPAGTAAPCRARPNATYGCESALILGALGGVELAPTNQGSCTYRHSGYVNSLRPTSIVPGSGPGDADPGQVGAEPGTAAPYRADRVEPGQHLHRRRPPRHLHLLHRPLRRPRLPPEGERDDDAAGQRAGPGRAQQGDPDSASTPPTGWR